MGTKILKMIKLHCIHNKNKSPIKYRKFGQDLEPHGKYYITVETKPDWLPDNSEYKLKVFNNPLIIPFKSTCENGWKNDLYKKYKLKGRKLSLFLISSGYDAIITKDENEYKEIVSFQEFDINHKDNRKIIH